MMTHDGPMSGHSQCKAQESLRQTWNFCRQTPQVSTGDSCLKGDQEVPAQYRASDPEAAICQAGEVPALLCKSLRMFVIEAS